VLRRAPRTPAKTRDQEDRPDLNPLMGGLVWDRLGVLEIHNRLPRSSVRARNSRPCALCLPLYSTGTPG
jgi:hypothetical protein